MIRNTHKLNPEHVISAYSDNAAVMEGQNGSFLAPSLSTGEWTQIRERVHYLAKVETHNHPTAVVSDVRVLVFHLGHEVETCNNSWKPYHKHESLINANCGLLNSHPFKARQPGVCLPFSSFPTLI